MATHRPVDGHGRQLRDPATVDTAVAFLTASRPAA
jgi:hypothetical protein